MTISEYEGRKSCVWGIILDPSRGVPTAYSKSGEGGTPRSYPKRSPPWGRLNLTPLQTFDESSGGAREGTLNVVGYAAAIMGKKAVGQPVRKSQGVLGRIAKRSSDAVEPVDDEERLVDACHISCAGAGGVNWGIFAFTLRVFAFLGLLDRWRG